MRKVCLVSSGMTSSHVRLQPWMYLWETACGLARAGHEVTVLTDTGLASSKQLLAPDLMPNRPAVEYVPSLNLRRTGPGSLIKHLEMEGAQAVVWHVGKTSFLRGPYPRLGGAFSLGIFTSPLYNSAELLRIGLPQLLGNLSLSAIHLLGTFLPACIFRKAMGRSGLDWLVTETETTAGRLVKDELWSGPLKTIFPAVNRIWFEPQTVSSRVTRQALGLTQEEKVFLYLGSSAPLRGLPVLIKAFQQARQQNPGIKLLILSREPGLDGDGFKAEECLPGSGVWVIRRFLEPAQVAQVMAACDIVALPFTLVPSDAPLSLLEAAALGKPVVTTRSACLPELAALGRGILAEPGDVKTLSSALLQAVAEKNSEAYSLFTRSWEQVGKDWSRLIENL